MMTQEQIDASTAEQKSTSTSVMGVIDSHLRSCATFGGARRDLLAIIGHAEERLDHLAWFLEVGESNTEALANIRKGAEA